MIFKTKDLIEKNTMKDYRGFTTLGNAFYLKCEDQSFKRNIDSWECKLFYVKKVIEPGKRYNSIIEFEVKSPFIKDKMLKALDKSLQEDGKQKLIRAIYDFQ